MLDLLLVMQSLLSVSPQVSSLAQNIAQCSIGHFADGETHISWSERPDFAGKNIWFWNQVQFSVYDGSIVSPINSQIFDMCCAARAIKECGATQINLILPYLPYSRQDKPEPHAKKGQLHLVAEMLALAGVSEIICLDVHNEQILSSLPVPVRNISCAYFWHSFLVSQQFLNIIGTRVSDVVIASPDQGGCGRAQAIAGNTFSWVCARKERVGKDMVRMIGVDGDVRGKVVVLCDDIIDTAGTAIKACDMLLAQGASKVVGCFTHAVLSANAIERIQKSSFAHVFVTDSINLQGRDLGTKISVAPISSFVIDQLSFEQVGSGA